jgi:hypothetical protein
MRHLVWLSGALLVLSCTVNSSNLNVDAGGTGGGAATGGRTGSGGASATGGATASGGQTGTGGDGQQGGTTGAGGSATGAGGNTGAGGSGAGGDATGAGGSGTGGGQGGQGGESCDKLASDYAGALTAAKACTPGATNQCQKLVDGTIGCSGCKAYVNDTTTLDQIQNQWDSQGCVRVCSAIACVTPPSTCTGSGPTTGGPGGGANPAGTCTGGGLVSTAR